MTSLPAAGEYNAAADLIGRNLAAGRGGKIAVIDDDGSYTYAELAERVGRCANALRGLGLAAEQRILLCLLDTIDFPTVFLGAITAGIVPVAANTMLTAEDYAFMLADSRAQAVVVAPPLLPAIAAALEKLPGRRPLVILAGAGAAGAAPPSLAALLAAAAATAETEASAPDLPCFWLYSSGSTGRPKGTVHLQANLIRTAELYAVPVLGIAESDVVYSAAKLFFAYGLGNALTFPMAVGATAILAAGRPTPAAVTRILLERRPTIFCGVPTLYSALLADPALPGRGETALRRCVSAGEPLPEEIGRRWSGRLGVDILDGIGSTEMLHIYLSNRPGRVRYGTTGEAVPGYALRLLDEAGGPVAAGEIGELQVSGPSCAAYYWNSRAKSCETFLGPWLRTGDKYRQDAEGRYVYCGRTDDMLKVGGIYVSPAEVEAALAAHEAVLEAAVIGVADAAGLVKPKAFVVTRPGIAGDDNLAEALKSHVKARLAPYKYPRSIEFMAELPKTATGKIQRFRLRALEAERAAGGTHSA